MRIAFFGSSFVSAYWNGAATYYRGLLSAWRIRGHDDHVLRARRLRAAAASRHRRSRLVPGRRLPGDEPRCCDALGALGDADSSSRPAASGSSTPCWKACSKRADRDPRHLLGCGCAGHPRSAGRGKRTVRRADPGVRYGPHLWWRTACRRLSSDGALAPAFRSTTRSTPHASPGSADPSGRATFSSSAIACRIGRRGSGLLPRRRRSIGPGSSVPARRQRLGERGAAANVQRRSVTSSPISTMSSTARRWPSSTSIATAWRRSAGRRPPGSSRWPVRRLPDYRRLGGHRAVPYAGEEVLVAAKR